MATHYASPTLFLLLLLIIIITSKVCQPAYEIQRQLHSLFMCIWMCRFETQFWVDPTHKIISQVSFYAITKVQDIWLTYPILFEYFLEIEQFNSPHAHPAPLVKVSVYAKTRRMSNTPKNMQNIYGFAIYVPKLGREWRNLLSHLEWQGWQQACPE